MRTLLRLSIPTADIRPPPRGIKQKARASAVAKAPLLLFPPRSSCISVSDDLESGLADAIRRFSTVRIASDWVVWFGRWVIE